MIKFGTIFLSLPDEKPHAVFSLKNTYARERGMEVGTAPIR
ncbi:hypothetical protein CWATWH0005_1585 [Crocosphaera watsonii WH 0005]|uniref:Uncharacterized protein n=1 Tax=Crocosphaera watsonii WH 0005 TaxID=423472 RepID=T2IXS8_CROWT|nr:hypothetical protein CWATWH0005_1585 [Crocosphaera watsonii WH 0005]